MVWTVTATAVEPEVLAGQPAVSIERLFWAVDDARVYCVGSSEQWESSLAVSACVSFVALCGSAALRWLIALLLLLLLLWRVDVIHELDMFSFV